MSLLGLARKFGFVVLGLVVLAVVAAVIGYRTSEAMGLAELQATGRHRLDVYAASLERETDKYAYLPATLGLQQPVMDLLDGPSDAATTRSVDLYLEQLNGLTGTLSIYILDRRGRVLASSNWNRPDSFVGEDLSYRPYFQEAAARRNGRLFGIGTTRGEPGYYLSSPLIRQEQLIGVAVVKVGLEQLEQSWSTVEAPSLVTDENGVVILSSVPSWKFTTVRPMDDETRRGFERNHQYNARPLPPLGVRNVRSVADGSWLVTLPHPDGATNTMAPISGWFLAQTAALPGTPWTLTVLSPIAQVSGMARTTGALAGIGAAFVAILFVMLNQRRRHLRDRLTAREDLQRAHDDLERKVKERTLDLSAANSRLQEEVSERRRTEGTLRAAQAELVHAGKLAVIGQLSAGLAHELNQPLAALRTLSGNAVKFLERGDRDAAVGNLQRVGQLVDGMGRLTSQLKSFARKSAGTPQPMAVRRAIDNALLLLDERLRRAGVAIRQDPQDGDAIALCDANRLEQVLVNLIGNALDAVDGRPDAALDLSVERNAGRVLIRVRDTGPGLAEDILPRLFEPFFTTKEAGAGLGLGLAISAGIVRDFGGTLTGANHPAGGAVFTVDLPAARIGETECPTR